MDTIEIVYLICFFVGLGFAVVSGLLSGMFGGDAGGGAEADVGGPGDGAIHFSPLSPVVLATFVATFGGSGIIYKKVLGWTFAAHLPASAASAVVVAGLVWYFFWRIFKATQGSSHVRAEEAIGRDAQVTVPIPNHGVGQIAYTLGGFRQTNAAQSADGKELPAGLTVRIVRRVGNTFVVEKSP